MAGHPGVALLASAPPLPPLPGTMTLAVISLVLVALASRVRFGSWLWGLALALWAGATTLLSLRLQAWWMHGAVHGDGWWLVVFLGLVGLGWAMLCGAVNNRHGGHGLSRILASAGFFATGMLAVTSLTLAWHGGLARQVAVGELVAVAPLVVAVLVFRRIVRRLLSSHGSRPVCGWTLANSLTGYGVFACGCLQAPVIGLIAVALGRSRMQWLRTATRIWMRVVYAMTPTVRWRFTGDIDALNGRRLVVANHESMLDILSAGGLPGVRNLLAKTWVFRAPFLGIGARAAGIHNVDALSVDAYLEHPDRLLGEREGLFVFPEGRRSRDGLVGRFHLGAFHLATAAQSQVVPVAMCGSRWSLPPTSLWIHPGELQSVVLRPISRAPQEPVRVLADRVRAALSTAAIAGRRQLLCRSFNCLNRRGWFLGLGPLERLSAAREDAQVRDALAAGFTPGRWLQLGAGHGAAALIMLLLAPGAEILVIEPHARVRNRLLAQGLAAGQLSGDLPAIWKPPSPPLDGIVCLWRDAALVCAAATRFVDVPVVILSGELVGAWRAMRGSELWESSHAGAFAILRRTAVAPPA